MGQIVSLAAKPKRCNLNKLSQLGTPAAGEYILVSSDNSMNAAGQGNFDCYIVGDGTTVATALPLIKTYANDVDDEPVAGSENLVKSGGIATTYGAYTENPEWVYVTTDSEDKILFGVKTDGSIYFGAGIPPQVQEYVENLWSTYRIDDISNFIGELLDGTYSLAGLLNLKVSQNASGDATIVRDASVGRNLSVTGNETVGTLNVTGNATLGGDTTISGDVELGGANLQSVQNPEYLQVITDSENKILEGIKTDGTKVIELPMEIQGVRQETIDNPEFIQVTTDYEGKVIEATRRDGKKVFPGGIEELDNVKEEIDNIYPLKNYQFPKPLYSIGHRGYSYNVPEQTVQAFLYAKQEGFDFAEFDVQFTSDGVPVLMHDVSINRVARNTDGTVLSETINIRDITYEDALEYDYGIYQGEKWAGLKLLTLYEAVILAKKLGLYIMLESKYNTPLEVERIVQIVREYDMLESCIFQSFDRDALRVIINQYPQAKILFIASITQENIDILLSLSNKTTNCFIGVQYLGIQSNSDIELATANGINVILYTVNDESYITDVMPLGVWGVISDRYVASKILNDDMMTQIIF